MQIAVVTGANKGIGYGIVRALAKQLNGIVYLTARSEQLGKAALDSLNAELGGQRKCSELRFHQLDIADQGSIDRLKQHLQQQHGGLDILVNNAGIAYKQSSTASFAEQAEVTNRTNFFGTLHVCESLFPLLNKHARVVNVCSQAGLLGGWPDDRIRSQLLLAGQSLSMDKLKQIVEHFIQLAAQNQHVASGYKDSAYGVSKASEIAMSKIQQQQIDTQRPGDDILISACCPGYVDTDMTSHKGHLTIDQGAETPVYLALVAANSTDVPRGEFWYQKQLCSWDGKMKF